MIVLHTGCRMKAVGFRQGFRSQVQTSRLGFEVLLAAVFSQLSLSISGSAKSCAMQYWPMHDEGPELSAQPNTTLS